MTKRKNAAETLLEILERVPDVSHVEVLIEPENLLFVLEACGHSRDDVRAKLKAKTTPGELLLGLLDAGHRGEALVAMLPEHRRTPPPAPQKKASRRAARAAQRGRDQSGLALTDDMSLLNNIGGVLLFVAAVAPALLLAGVFGDGPIGSQDVWLLVAGLAGAVAGALFATGRKQIVAGIVCGALASIGGLLLTELWIGYRVEFMRIEIAVAALLGMLPALFLYEKWPSRDR